MRIVRNSASTGFTQVPNVAVRDKRLSYKARGLLAVLLSHKDGWQIDAHGLADDSPDGRKAILSGLRELVDCGYVVYVNRRGSDGRMRKEMTVYEVPPGPGPGSSEAPVDNPADRGSKTAPRSAKNSQIAPRSPHGTSADGTSVHGTCIEDQQEDQKEDHPEDQDELTQKISQSAQEREAARHLRDVYGDGLTDFVISRTLAVAKDRALRAGRPAQNLKRYIESWAEGDLADVVGAAMDADASMERAEVEPPPPALRPLSGGASSSASTATQPSLFIRAVPDVEPKPAPAPAQEAPRDLALPDDTVTAALDQLKAMSSSMYQSAAARWFASRDLDATTEQVRAYALQLAWSTPADRDVLAATPGVAAALTERSAG